MSTPQGKERRAPVTQYEIFGRKNSSDHLYHLGTVSAPNRELAIVHAVKTFDEHRWIELCMVPRETVISITGPEGRTRIGVA